MPNTVADAPGSGKTDSRFLDKHLAATQAFEQQMQHYVRKGPELKPIRPEFLAATLSQLAAADAMFFADTGTACMWLARHIQGGKDRRLFGSFSWASMANAALDDVLKTAQRNLGLL